MSNDLSDPSQRWAASTVKGQDGDQAPVKRGFAKTWVMIRQQKSLYLMIIPAVAFTFVFNYVPLYGLSLAFRDFNAALGPYRSPWAEPLFYNFWFFRDSQFWFVLLNTLRISAVKFVFSWPAPIMLALLLNEVTKSGFKRVIQTITYLPHFLSWVVMAGIIYKILDYEPTSPINILRSFFDLEPIALLGNPSAFIPILVVSAIIKEVGWGTIIYLAAIMAIDPQLYEAAIVDGAGKLRQLWHVTIPGMLPTVSILLILSVPGLLQAGFDQIYNLRNSQVARIANVTDIYVLEMGLVRGEFAYATALGLIFSILAFLLTFLANKGSKGAIGSGIW